MVFNSYRKSSSYGWRTLNGTREFHAGIDLFKAHKSAIKSFTSGKVIHAGFGNKGTGLGGYGNCVMVEHNGHGLLYAHLDSVAVNNGQSVNANTILGNQGETGHAYGSHLHFEVRKGVTPSFGWTSDKSKSTLDPTNYVKNLPHNQSSGRGQVLHLPKTSSSWRVYPTNKAPTKGNEKGFLNPKKFGGLEYDILGNPQTDVYTIQSDDFGKVNIYAASSTGAKITSAKPKGETVYLPKGSSSWRVYPTGKAPKKGNEKGFLNPKKFGGLSYKVLGKPQKDVVTIQTSDFGKVNIYVASSTGATIK